MESEANAVEGGTIGAEEEGGGATGALVVTTPTLNKDAAMVDEGATAEPTKAAGALTSTTRRVTL